MRTVASLMAELAKFPPDAVVDAYEGEFTGLFVRLHTEDHYAIGIIHCAGGKGEELETQLFPPAPAR